VAVGTEKYPGKYDFLMAQINEPAGLIENNGHRFGAKDGPRSGNDAECAVGIAAILNPHFGSNMG